AAVTTVMRGPRPPHGLAGRLDPHQDGELGDRLVDHCFRGSSLLLVESCSSSAESFPWTSITASALSGSARSRSFSFRSRAASFCAAVARAAPPERPSASRSPRSRHALISEEYKPSRCSSAPFPL